MATGSAGCGRGSGVRTEAPAPRTPRRHVAMVTIDGSGAGMSASGASGGANCEDATAFSRILTASRWHSSSFSYTSGMNGPRSRAAKPALGGMGAVGGGGSASAVSDQTYEAGGPLRDHLPGRNGRHASGMEATKINEKAKDGVIDLRSVAQRCRLDRQRAVHVGPQQAPDDRHRGVAQRRHAAAGAFGAPKARSRPAS